MKDQNLARGLFLAAIALAFGIGAMRYPIGQFSRAGPGLFPLMVSGLLLVVALSMIIRSFFVKPEPMHFQFKNIALLMAALGGFALVSHFVNMIAGIVLMVFIAAYAGSTHSWKLSLKIAAGLVAIAFAFQKLLGLNLPLY